MFGRRSRSLTLLPLRRCCRQDPRECQNLWNPIARCWLLRVAESARSSERGKGFNDFLSTESSSQFSFIKPQKPHISAVRDGLTRSPGLDAELRKVADQCLQAVIV